MKKFVNYLFKGKTPDEKIAVLRKQGGFIPQFVDNADEIELYHCDMYINCCTLRNGIKKGRGKKEDIHSVYAVWVDIDFAVEGHKKEGLPTKDTVDEILNNYPIPTFCVSSGGGYHLWYCLDKPVRAVAEIEHFVAEFQQGLRRHFTVDSTHNLDRILRLPGTNNYKRGKPVPVTYTFNDVRYTLDDLKECCAPVEQKRKTSNIVVQPNVDCPQIPQSALSVFNRTKEGVGDGSPSAYDFSLAILLIKEGWNDQDIANAIIASRKRGGFVDAKIFRADYHKRTIERARAKVEAEKMIADVIGEIEFKKLIKYLTEPPTYKLITGFGDVNINSVDQLLSPNKLRNRIAEDLNVLIIQFPKTKVFMETMKPLVESAEIVFVADEATDEGYIKMLLEQYKEDIGIADDADENCNLFYHRGELCLNLEQFRRFMDVTANFKIASKALAKVMRDIGYSPKKIRLNGKEMRIWKNETPNR